jgi:membrane protease subunit (stomatin/prohibitin family)
MGIFDRFRGEFIDIIEWLDPTQDTMAYRFERHDNEIKNGAKLIVRPGQDAVFVNEGEVADEFGPGTYTLETKNLPILSTLQGWRYGFDSPFKAEVYFFNTKIFTGLKWGTANPVTLRDKELGPVRVRAYGTYTLRIAHPATLLRQLISTDGLFQTGEIEGQLRSFMVGHFATWLGKANLSVYDFAARYTEIGEAMREALRLDFAQYGLEVMQVQIENISLPPEVEATLDKRTQMGIAGDLNQYTRFQAAEAIEASANNPAGGNAAMDIAVGLAMGQQVARQMQEPAAAGATPPPLPQQTQWYVGQDGQRQGPFDVATLRQQIASGTVGRDTLVWRQGMAQWQAAGEVADLAPLFDSVPPPLPPSA